MHYSFLMHVLQGARNLMHVLNDALLREVDFIFHSLLDDELQVSLFGPLHSNEKFVELAIDEPTEVLDDVLLI